MLWCLVVVISVGGRVILAPHIHDNVAGSQLLRIPATDNGGVLVAGQQLQHGARQHLQQHTDGNQLLTQVLL